MTTHVTHAVPAGLVGALVSGAPSTLFAVLTGRPLLEATEAAGSILLPRETRRTRLIASAAVVHLAVSLFWAHALAMVLPRRRAPLCGALAGLGIAGLDLVVVGRRFPRVRALPLGPQVADHVAFGVVVAMMLRTETPRCRPDEPADS